MNYKLNVAWLYPDLMSTYGDRGNIFVLNKRCEWRGIDITIKTVTLETPFSHLESCDLIFMGGAQDRQQKLAGEDFVQIKGPVVKKMVENDTPALFVCAAYQFVGHYYRPYQGEDIRGASIFDLVTVHPGDQAKRLVGNVVAELMPHATWPMLNEGKTIVGFENHGGRTTLGSKMKPLARVIKGFGNNGEDGYEGALYKNAIGSYFHGPLLTKNPHIADWLIHTALDKKYNKDVQLARLDDALESNAHNHIIKTYG